MPGLEASRTPSAREELKGEVWGDFLGNSTGEGLSLRPAEVWTGAGGVVLRPPSESHLSRRSDDKLSYFARLPRPPQ